MLRRFPLLMAGCLFLCVTPVFAAKPAAKKPIEEQIQRSLERAVIPTVAFDEASVGEVLEFLRRETRRLNPKGPEIHFVMPDKPPESPLAPDPGSRKMTVHLNNIPALELLRYVTGLNELKFRIRPDGIHIVPISDAEPMFTRDFRISPKLFSPGDQRLPLGGADGAAKLKSNPRQFLIEQGVNFPEGAAAILNDEGTRLTVHNTRDQLDLIGTVLTLPPPPPKEVPIAETRKEDLLAEARKYVPAAQSRRRLRSIALPQVSLDKVPLKEALATLESLGKRHDPGQRTASRGVPIRLIPRKAKAAPAGVPAGPVPGIDALPETLPPIATPEPAGPVSPVVTMGPNPRITYSAANIGFLDALQAVARLGQYRVEVHSSEIVVTDATPGQRLVIQEWKLPPEGLPHVKESAASAPDESGKAKDWLVTGVGTLEGGASAIYIVRTRRLIVRDTPEKLHRDQEAVEDLWLDYYTAETAKQKKR